MLRDLLGEHLLKGEGHSGQLPPLIFSDWSLEMAIVAGRQEREILSY